MLLAKSGFGVVRKRLKNHVARVTYTQKAQKCLKHPPTSTTYIHRYISRRYRLRLLINKKASSRGASANTCDLPTLLRKQFGPVARMPVPRNTEPASLPWHYISKLVCIGDSGCGKSSLTIRLCEGRFSNTHDVTIGVEFGSRIVPVGPPANEALRLSGQASRSDAASSGKAVDQKKMKLSLWDTAGQETYKSITRSYFRGASGALLVFDLSRRSTFESVTNWLNDLRQIAEDGIVVILVGNKADLADTSTDIEGGNKRAVTRQEAEEWCRREGVMTYVETSAKSGEGVERAFIEVAERIYQNIEAGKYDLEDRRSGVKKYGIAAGRSGDVNRGQQSVTLNVNDAKGGKKGWAGGCC